MDLLNLRSKTTMELLKRYAEIEELITNGTAMYSDEYELPKIRYELNRRTS